MSRNKINPTISDEILETFQFDMKTFGLECALHNYTVNLVSGILKKVGVHKIHVTTSSHKKHRQPA